MEDLLAAHHAEINDYPETPILPDWAQYRRLERMGAYKTLLARDERRRLIGYNSFFVQAPLRSVTSLWAINDFLYLDPTWRKGRTGVDLIKRPEADLKVDLLTYPGVSDYLAALLSRLGYRDVGRVMAKGLK